MHIRLLWWLGDLGILHDVNYYCRLRYYSMALPGISLILKSNVKYQKSFCMLWYNFLIYLLKLKTKIKGILEFGLSFVGYKSKSIVFGIISVLFFIVLSRQLILRTWLIICHISFTQFSYGFMYKNGYKLLIF